MRYVLAALILIGFVGLASAVRKCDCNHFPWEPPDCARRCGDSFLAKELQQSDFIIELSSIAEARGASPDLKAIAARAADERKQLRAKIISVAERRDAALGAEPDNRNRDVVQRLRGKTGHDFDALYLSTLVKITDAETGHLRVVARGANDADIKAIAIEILPLVREENHQLRALLGRQ
jgi:putative membrane protein